MAGCSVYCGYVTELETSVQSQKPKADILPQIRRIVSKVSPPPINLHFSLGSTPAWF